jgi:hypothetical protein
MKKKVTGRPFPRRTLQELVPVKPQGMNSTTMISEDRDRE